MVISMNIIEIFSLIASGVSIILAIVAISLAIVFYNMTTKLTLTIKEASDNINSSVQRIEGLFSKFYTDTFGMMKDAYTDMRKHVWPDDTSKIIEDETNRKIEDKVNEFKNELDSKVSDILRKQKFTDEKLTSVTRDFKRLIDEAVSKSRKIESDIKNEELRKIIYDIISRFKVLEADDLLMALDKEYNIHITPKRMVNELFEMKRSKILELNSETVRPHTIISLIKH